MTLCTLAGCRPPLKFNPVKQDVPKRTPPNMISSGITVNWYAKKKDGTLEKLIDIEAETGTLIPGKQSGMLRNTRGILYKEGKPVARFESPLVNAEEETKVVHASGGVVAHSIDPPGVTLWANRVIWTMEKDQVLAKENVKFQYIRAGETIPFAEGGPVQQCTVNTSLKNFHIP